MSLAVCYYRKPGSSWVDHCEFRFSDGTLFSSVPGTGPRCRAPETLAQPFVGAVETLEVTGTPELEADLQSLAAMLDHGSTHNGLGRFLATWTPFSWAGEGWYDAEVVAFFLRLVGLPLKDPAGYSANSLYLAHKKLRS